MAVILLHIMLMLGYGLANRLRTGQNATASARCCCSRKEPVPKYVCIDPHGSDEVFSPVSEVLKTKDFDPRIMFKPTSAKDRKMLQATQEDRQEHSITVTTQVVSKCAGDKVKLVSADSIKKLSKEMKAPNFKYKGLTWSEYLETPERYKGEGHHVVIDGVVYKAYLETKLPIPQRNVCVQKVTAAWLETSLGRSTCIESTRCQEYETTHACGWGTFSGNLYRRVGRIDGECVAAEKLREGGFFGGLFGGRSDKCPSRMFHRISGLTREARGTGFLFCECNGDCS